MASEDVLDREEVRRLISVLCTGDRDNQEKAERALETHDAALRARIEELEVVVRTLLGPHRPGGEATNASLDNTSTYELYATGSTICRARRALESDHGEQENG